MKFRKLAYCFRSNLLCCGENLTRALWFHYSCYIRRRLASGEGIVTLGVMLSRSLCVCLSAEPRLHATLVSATKVMRCIQCSPVIFVFPFSDEIYFSEVFSEFRVSSRRSRVWSRKNRVSSRKTDFRVTTAELRVKNPEFRVEKTE